MSRKLLGRSQLFFHRLFDVILILYVIVDDVIFGTLSLILKFFYDSFCGELISETIEEKIKEKMGWSRPAAVLSEWHQNALGRHSKANKPDN